MVTIAFPASPPGAVADSWSTTTSLSLISPATSTLVPSDRPVDTPTVRSEPSGSSTVTVLASPSPCTALTGTVSTSIAWATLTERVADMPSQMLPSLGTSTVTVNLEPLAW